MDSLTAHGLLSLRTDRSIYPNHVVATTAAGETDAWPAFVTAIAVLSGALDDAYSVEQLDEAISHGLTLINCEVINNDDLHDETMIVIREVLDACAVH